MLIDDAGDLRPRPPAQLDMADPDLGVGRHKDDAPLSDQPADGLRWRAWFHEVDLGLIEIVPATLPLVEDRFVAARRRTAG